MDTRREFLRKSLLLSGATGLATVMPSSIQRALAIDPIAGSTYLDAEHIVILMQENRSFDHAFGSLQGVRGFNDPRAITLPDQKPVWFQTDATGNTYAPFRLNIKDTKVTWMGSLPHSRASQVDAYNEGKYDKWLLAKKSGNKSYAQMPLTLGHYTREDLPFNYALADAFTICDQNFCSAMTSTTPNRSFFWTGKITHEDAGIQKAHIRNDDFAYAKLPWKTFPELLEENRINWKFYQNETSCGGGFKGEERAWLSNFGCNLLEFFKAYNVKFKPKYIESLQKQVDTLPGEINKLQEASPSSDAASKKIQADLKNKMKALDDATAELEKWNEKNFAKLTDEQKGLFYRAFVVNEKDPDYRNIASVKYNDGGKEREVSVPKGDVLHQFRQDVNSGKLPTVSWLAGPQNFSDHPSAPWYGAWYVSEVMDILTKNPEVWKKTIFIVTYDENDGYYDHVPPFSIPDSNKPETGKVSEGIDTEIEHVRLANELKQGVSEKGAREAPIGLGFRVPMLIASPWSRGGKVCSQLFDHTSTLQFLEEFVNKKYNKNLHLENISQWRRTISGNLTSAFAPFDPASEKLPFLNRDAFVETIFNAKFKEEPNAFKALSNDEIKKAINGTSANLMSRQEKGIRKACALPYQLLAGGSLSSDKRSFQINMATSNQIFGKQASGAPFTVYAPVKFKDDNQKEEICRNWSFAVKANDNLQYSWPINSFEDGKYHLRLNGPNGFFREFTGTANDPVLTISADNELNRLTKAPTGNIKLLFKNSGNNPVNIQLTDLGYKGKELRKTILPKTEEAIVLDLKSSFGWYDFEIKSDANSLFMQRFAGRIETGKESFTDPVMGKV
ncbi:phosphocholine-specific phospholipase C [Pedobacter paludis]|uniref:phospholipase C n=1 Tax=Pedobacter paludis TaxID=2203212 RepID=A0A317EVX2_9SPHI|nr:phospholipase C, phosphocholine-specific [Pedobacter paludis]PWS31110.1 phospholipase C, phosphocholine-specific [Pedobacter paludis]